MTPEPTPDRSADYAAIAQSETFHRLRRAHLSFIVPATVVFMAWYVLYVICSNWARGFMSIQLVGHINVAVVFGLLQFVSTFLIAWLYSRHSARTMDPLSAELREGFENGSAA